MTQSTGAATHTITVGINYNTEPLSQLESQLEHIAELLERIREQTLVDINSAVIGSAQTAKITGNDDHLRQIVRKEIRQFVQRESRRGGLFSRW
ncbi:hypothetical protein [Xenorhabdus littoralis]|uniref:hypothetical protein n=1 Tax=Xenorhabdus littoralis TaxID=2582835 RepID=UPI0029E7EC83|nr:hypothetical protein [Xenorhabdus sp. psl]MDX7989871.1 hypothetical protein [Xenorhabdus sp. psl]